MQWKKTKRKRIAESAINNNTNKEMTAKEKDQILSEIKDDTFDYNKSIHGEIITELRQSEYIDITRTKDGSYFDITDKGLSFLNSGGYVATIKKKNRERLKKNLERLFFTVLGGLLLALLQKLMPALL